jgi:hypothetical protein
MAVLEISNSGFRVSDASQKRRAAATLLRSVANRVSLPVYVEQRRRSRQSLAVPAADAKNRPVPLDQNGVVL